MSGLSSTEHHDIREVVILDEDITGVCLIVKVRVKTAHHADEIIALINDVLCESLLRFIPELIILYYPFI